ncbi:MAG: glycoside hydrolase family 2 protein [Bacteroidota bacterium]
MWCKKNILLLFGFFFCIGSQTFSQVNDTLFLDKNWSFTESGTSNWFSATVPGTIHTDLLANKIIPDPYFGCNEISLLWIETINWEYKCNFFVDEKTLNNQHIDLVAEGLDTYATVYVNNQLVISADNMFREWTADCKKYLKVGNNQVRIIFESAVAKGKEQAKKLPYTLPGDEKVFVRKAQYHFGWDWGPRLVTCGIYKPIFLQIRNDCALEEVQFIQRALNKNEAWLAFHSKIIVDTPQAFVIKISDTKTGNVYATQHFNPGNDTCDARLDFVIKNPVYWWTHDLGEPYLYHFTVQVLLNNTCVEQRNLNVGLRTIEVVNEKDQYGESFYFKLNGVAVFMKGANYIPQDNFLPRVTRKNYEDLINIAVNNNMNMLRVWGGGVYENDLFYDLCDEKGVLVWQDFMFACAMYPADSAFLNNVKIEAIQQVTRLRNHPCLALWCGNNEIDEGWNNWGWQKQYNYSLADSTKIWADYVALFKKTLPDVIQAHDSNRFYWQSSPQYGWGREKSYSNGDSHYWGVWWGMQPFEIYVNKTGRFVSEYGFQGFPEKSTLEKISNTSDRFLFSDVLKCHQKHPTGFQTLKNYMLREYNEPTSLDDYIYISQLLQAYGMKTAIEAHRNAKPRCMGTLYWQFNDCWPVVSWSGTDYYHNPKAFQYFVKKAYNDILVTVNKSDKTINVQVISDKLNALTAQLDLKLLDFDGKTYWQQQKEINIPANSSQIIENIDKSILPADSLLQSSLVFVARVVDNKRVITENFFYFKKPKDLVLTNPGITFTIESISGGFAINIQTKKLAKNVFIYFENHQGTDVVLSDNFFDLLPGTSTRILAKTNLPTDELIKNLKVTSLFDIIK